jgi:D-glycero-alpha-D-manno-heptose-7-phosphate kinase
MIGGSNMARASHDPSSGVVVTRTPLRISFAGGGTDLLDFCQKDYGAVLSTAIDKYVYVTVKRHGDLFDEPIRINYSETELVQEVDQIKNAISRECLRLLSIEPPIYISTVADIPASTGLGSSSTFAVGLLNALHAFQGERVSAGQLAEEASYIEIEVLEQPIGKQDQYVAAYGGLNFFRFNSSGTVAVEPQRLPNGGLDSLFRHVLLFWTGIRRDADQVLNEQKSRTLLNMEHLRHIRQHALQLQTMMCEGFDPEAFGSVLAESWQLKRQLASSITSRQIDAWYCRAIEAGAEGGKLCGAGGGGFLLFIVRPERQNAVRQALGELKEVPIRYEAHGSRLLLPFIG